MARAKKKKTFTQRYFVHILVAVFIIFGIIIFTRPSAHKQSENIAAEKAQGLNSTQAAFMRNVMKNQSKLQPTKLADGSLLIPEFNVKLPPTEKHDTHYRVGASYEKQPITLAVADFNIVERLLNNTPKGMSLEEIAECHETVSFRVVTESYLKNNFHPTPVDKKLSDGRILTVEHSYKKGCVAETDAFIEYLKQAEAI